MNTPEQAVIQAARVSCSAVRGLPAKPGFLPDYECHNGFPISGSCLGTDGTPMCCREEACGRIYEHIGGWPLGKPAHQEGNDHA